MGEIFPLRSFVQQKTAGTANENMINGQKGNHQKEMRKAKLLVRDMTQVSISPALIIYTVRKIYPN